VNECIETTWPRDQKGYGKRTIDGVRWVAHRWAWTQANGPIPDGKIICHACDNPPCVNVTHLWLGTHAQNIADRDAKGRTATGDRNGSRTHPERRPRGPAMRHPKPGESNGRAVLTEANVIVIRELAHVGHSYRGLAREYGVSPRTIARIVKGEDWAHV
jgi:hypothetical protein